CSVEPLRAGRIDVYHPVHHVVWDCGKRFSGQVAVRIDYHKAFAPLDVLVYQLAYRDCLAGSRLAENAYVHPVFGVDAIGPAVVIAVAQDVNVSRRLAAGLPSLPTIIPSPYAYQLDFFLSEIIAIFRPCSTGTGLSTYLCLPVAWLTGRAFLSLGEQV